MSKEQRIQKVFSTINKLILQLEEEELEAFDIIEESLTRYLKHYKDNQKIGIVTKYSNMRMDEMREEPDISEYTTPLDTRLMKMKGITEENMNNHIGTDLSQSSLQPGDN